MAELHIPVDELVARLEKARDVALSDSDSSEGEFCVGDKDHEEMRAERAELTAVIDEVIRRLRPR